MNITANAASLNWRTNNHGVWKALVKDMAPNSSVTFSDGLTGTVSGKQVTVESQPMPTGFMTYTTDDNTAVFGGVLYGAGTASDSLEAVSGGKTVRMGSVDLGTLEWNPYEDPSEQRPYGRTVSSVAGRNVGTVNMICSGYIVKYDNQANKVVYGNPSSTQIILIDSSLTGKTGAEIQASLSGVILYYELATPTTSTETAQSLALQTGVNNLALNERDSSFTLDYTGTEFTLPLDSTRKYAFSDNGVKSMLTGSTEQAVTGGQDMLVDVTRMFNGDTAAINAVTSWADMAVVMPEYLSNVAYNEGEVVGRSGGVTTAKWNQMIPNGNFASGTAGWSKQSTVSAWSVTDNVLTFVGSGSTYIRSDSSIIPMSSDTHKFIIVFDILSTSSSGAIRFLKNSVTSVYKILTLRETWSKASTLFTAVGGSYIRIESNLSTSVKNVMLFDLTLIYGAGHEPSTVAGFEADCAKWGKDLTQYQPYDAGTPMGGSATFSELHGVGTAKDTQDVVTGEKTVRMGSYTFTGNEDWAVGSEYPGLFYIVVQSAKVFGVVESPLYLANNDANTAWNAMPDKTIGIKQAGRLYIHDSTYSTKAEMQAHTAGKTIYYELATPTTFSETPKPLTTVQGLNNIHEQNMSITGVPLTMGYTGTDQTIPTETSSKYLARIDGVDSVMENVESIDVRGGRDRVIDLTYMFGAGNEPATAADFYKLFMTWLGYAIPYNKGSLVNFKGTGLKSVGFNLLDCDAPVVVPSSKTASDKKPLQENTWFVGVYGSSSDIWNPSYVSSYSITPSLITVASGSPGAYGVGYCMRCVPGREYRVEYTSGNAKWALRFYTFDGVCISTPKYNINVSSDSAVAPGNAYWIMVIYCSWTANTTATFANPCVHLQWSGGRNGDYEPYWDYTRPLPTLTYFEQGMNGRGTVRDEITQRQAVTRLAEVDMEDLEWTESSGSWTTTLSGMKSDTTAIVAENGFKPVVSGTTVTVQSDESPTGKLVYELANPSTVTFPEEVNTTAQVSDYGTESVVPANGYELVTAPFLGIVKYQDNYARTITKLPENYQSQNSMDALQLVLGQLLNVTLTSRFDAEEQAYGYTVTGDGVPGLIAAALTALAPVTGLTFRGGTYMPTDGMVALPDPTIQAITTIPASTSSYTLGEGVYSHAPNSVPTYTLPDVEDATVVHTAKLTVKMSASVLTANFRDSAGDAINYEAPTGTISSGTLLEYVCTYEPLASGWAVSARVVMQTA